MIFLSNNPQDPCCCWSHTRLLFQTRMSSRRGRYYPCSKGRSHSRIKLNIVQFLIQISSHLKAWSHRKMHICATTLQTIWANHGSSGEPCMASTCHREAKLDVHLFFFDDFLFWVVSMSCGSPVVSLSYDCRAINIYSLILEQFV